MKKISTLFSAFVLCLAMHSCTILQPGEVGVDVRYGKIQKDVLLPGIHHATTMRRKIIVFNTREVNYPFAIDFHTMEGIQAKTELTILYHIIPDSSINIYKKFGLEYQNILLRDNIITAMRQIGLTYKATELIVQRSEIENAIMERLEKHIGPFGFVIHSVMLKQIDLPDDIQETIEAQIKAVQTAKKIKIENEISREQLNFTLEKSQREKQQELDNMRLQLDFNIEKQKKENERILLEAQTMKTQQELLNSTLTDQLLKLRAIEMTEGLLKSTNAKVIITDGKNPIVLNNEGYPK